jgi:putative transposase
LILRRQIALYKERGIKPRRIDPLTRISLALFSRFFNRDDIFAKHLDESIGTLGVKVLKSPPRSPTANAICERVIGTIRRECLDWLVPLSASHLRSILKSWIPHYNTGRPHMALGPGVPDPPLTNPYHTNPNSRHRRGESYAVRANPILRGLHHEYFLAPACA